MKKSKYTRKISQICADVSSRSFSLVGGWESWFEPDLRGKIAASNCDSSLFQLEFITYFIFLIS